MFNKSAKGIGYVVAGMMSLAIASKLWVLGAITLWSTYGYNGLVGWVAATCVVIVILMVKL